MKLIIKSRQIFESHIDNIEEKYDCDIVFFDKGFKIEYDNYEIKFDNNIFYIMKPGMILQIMLEKESKSCISTPYGLMNISVKGIEFDWNQNPFKCYLKYIIKLEESESYINEMQMMIEN